MYDEGTRYWLVGWLVSPADPVLWKQPNVKTKGSLDDCSVRGLKGAYHRSGFRGPHSKAGCKSLENNDFSLGKVNPPGNIEVLP